MSHNRRKFLSMAALTTGALGLSGKLFAHQEDHSLESLPSSISSLRPMLDKVVPITVAERKQRIANAQELMAKNKIDAIFLEGTTSCFYYTGMRWGQSERTFGVVIPAKGTIAYVCPKFEEDRAMEQILPEFGKEVRCWEEHESPYQVIAGIIKDRGLQHRRVGMEERVRFFIADGVKKVMPGVEIVDATPVTAGCRMYKTKAEIDLMQISSDVTIEAYKAAFATIKEGMSQGELGANIAAAFRKLGYSGGAMVLFGTSSALPHGSIQPKTLKQGDVILVDGGTSVEGYASDITRTIVFGKPSQKQIDIWNLERRAQEAAFNAIKIGAPCEVVDAAARKVIEDAGFGKNYRLPGLPHRTGHGIGLEGHEWTNFVKGNKTPITPGLCFSNEPTIAVPGEFGIRLEDCLYIAEDGPHYFSKTSTAIDQPFG